MLKNLINFVNIHFRRSNNGVMQLIIIQVAAFLFLVGIKLFCVLLGYELYYQRICQSLFLPTRWEIFIQQPWGILTYFWFHEQFFSTLWDLMFLYAFGNIIVSIWHSRSLIGLYLLGGLLSGACTLIAYHFTPGLQHFQTGWLIGPSGCLYAIMVAAGSLLPRTSFHLPFLGNIKLKYIVNALIFLACFELISNQQPTALARLIGAASGYLYVRYIRKSQQKRSSSRY